MAHLAGRTNHALNILGAQGRCCQWFEIHLRILQGFLVIVVLWAICYISDDPGKESICQKYWFWDTADYDTCMLNALCTIFHFLKAALKFSYIWNHKKKKKIAWIFSKIKWFQWSLYFMRSFPPRSSLCLIALQHSYW